MRASGAAPRAVDAKAHAHRLFERFDVDIRGAAADRLGQQRVDQADDRCIVLTLEQVLWFPDFTRDVGQCEVFLNVADDRSRLQCATLVGVRQQRVEAFFGEAFERKRPVGQTAHLGQAGECRVGAMQRGQASICPGLQQHPVALGEGEREVR